MKKNILYLLVVASVMTLGFSSCSEDVIAPAKDVAKTYEGADIITKNDGVEIPEGVITIEAIDDNQAKVTLSNIVNGHANYQAIVPIIEKDGAHTFSISATEPGMKISVEGVILDGKAQVVANMTITATEIVGAWGFSTDFAAPALAFNIKNKSGKLAYYGDGDPREMTTDDFSRAIEEMIGMMLPAFIQDFSFTFNSNGYVGVKGKMASMEEEGKTEPFDLPKLARYYYNPTNKALIFDAPLSDLLPTRNTSNAIAAVLQVPFNCTFDSGKLTATVDQDFINQFIPLIPIGETLDTLLSMLDPVIPEAFKDLLPWIKGNIKTIAVAVTDTKNFESLTVGGRLISIDKK